MKKQVQTQTMTVKITKGKPPKAPKKLPKKIRR